MGPAFKLILISPEAEKRDEVKVLTRLFNHGLEVFHLRRPLWSMVQTRDYLQSVPSTFHDKITLHSHFALAGEFKIRGIHLNENNKKLISQFDSYRIISASFHSPEDIEENNYPYQYIFLSPIFNSISKPGHNSGFDLRILAEKMEALKHKRQTLPMIIALGGVSAENMHKVKMANFSGAAVSGAVWESGNPEKAFLDIQSKVLAFN